MFILDHIHTIVRRLNEYEFELDDCVLLLPREGFMFHQFQQEVKSAFGSDIAEHSCVKIHGISVRTQDHAFNEIHVNYFRNVCTYRVSVLVLTSVISGDDIKIHIDPNARLGHAIKINALN